MTDDPLSSPSSQPLSQELQRRTSLFAPIQALSRETTLPHFRTQMAVANKLDGHAGRFDPVTAADRACEEKIRALIGHHFPEDGIIGEEFGTTHDTARFVWVIDPIDGTRGFVAGLPLWGTLVGLLENGRPVAGLGYQPFIDEAFWSAGDGKAFTSHRGEPHPIRTRVGGRLEDATLMTTTPALFDAQERAAYDQLENTVRSVRYGADWYGYALLACGTADLVVESGLSAYDILPLVPLIEAAGGLVTDWTGTPLTQNGTTITGQVLAIGDPDLLEPAVKGLRPAARDPGNAS